MRRSLPLVQAVPEMPGMICVCLAGVQHENRDWPRLAVGRKSCLFDEMKGGLASFLTEKDPGYEM